MLCIFGIIICYVLVIIAINLDIKEIMINPPHTLEHAQRYVYDVKGKGLRYRSLYVGGACAYAVWCNGLEHQCIRKSGHGPTGLYCKQHAKRIDKRA